MAVFIQKGTTMTRAEKALQSTENRMICGDIQTQSGGTWDDCCPHYIDCGEDNMDDNTAMAKGVHYIGCRGITCVQCWAKEYTNEPA